MRKLFIVLLLLLAGVVAWLIFADGSWVARLGPGLLAYALMCALLIRSGPKDGRVEHHLLEETQSLKQQLAESRHHHEQLEHFFETLMENVPANIYFKDKNSCFLKVNRPLATYHHYDHPADLVGKSDNDLFGPEHAEEARRDELEIMESGKAKKSMIEREVFPDGTEGWVLTNKMPFRNKRGEIIGTFGMSSDVSELVNTQHTLERERNILRSLIDSFPDNIFIRDRERKYVVVNQAFVRFLGEETPEDVLGKTPEDFYQGEVMEVGRVEDEELLAGGKPVLNRQWNLPNAQGEQRKMLTTKVPLRDQDGKPFAIVGMDRDVTELRRTREELIKTERRMQEIMDNAPALIFLKSTSGEYLSVNSRYEAVYGLGRDQVIGKRDHEIHPPGKAREQHQQDTQVMEHEEVLQFEEVILRDDKSHTYLSTKFPLRDPRGRIYGLGGISTDITERKEAEKEMQKLNADLTEANQNLRSAQEQLIQAEKMESVGRLAAGVAHEVKNPLAMIGMGLELLSRKVPQDDPTASQAIDRMKRGLDRATKIIKGLLDFSSARQLTLNRHHLHNIIHNVTELASYELEKLKIETTIDVPTDLPAVLVDETKIEQVILNLIINSAQAMHEHAEGDEAAEAVANWPRELNIRAEQSTYKPHEHDEGSRTVRELHQGDSIIRLTLQDSGPGIPEDKLSKIFDPFFTTKSTGVGTGLGLSVSRKIVELHGGQLTMVNRKDRPGIIATITLKAAPEGDA